MRRVLCRLQSRVVKAVLSLGGIAKGAAAAARGGGVVMDLRWVYEENRDYGVYQGCNVSRCHGDEHNIIECAGLSMLALAVIVPNPASAPPPLVQPSPVATVVVVHSWSLVWRVPTLEELSRVIEGVKASTRRTYIAPSFHLPLPSITRSLPSPHALPSPLPAAFMRDSSAILPPPTNRRRPVKSCSPSHRPKLPLPRLNAFLIEPFERPARPSARTTPRLDTSLVKQPAPPSAAAPRTPVHHASRNPSSDPLGARPLRSSSTISGSEKGAGDAAVLWLCPPQGGHVPLVFDRRFQRDYHAHDAFQHQVCEGQERRHEERAAIWSTPHIDTAGPICHVTRQHQDAIIPKLN
uniref:Uncharacterized protein n=1 Tax=Oryza glumipatula TaxID=40148 RepID=A0A0E0B757_9ORYZ